MMYCTKVLREATKFSSVWLLMDRTTQIHFQVLVNSLSLAIRLRVISSNEAEFGTQQLEQMCPKGASKHVVSITDNGSR